MILQNDFLGTVSIFRDITHEVEVDRLKSEFVATVSHELRTPMTSIRGYVDVLLMGAAGALNENQTHFLSIVKNNTERLNILVNDLLDVSRIESGRVTLSPQALDLREIAADGLDRERDEIRVPVATLITCPAAAGAVGKDGKRGAFEKAESFSQWMITEKLISTVPWDDAGAYVRFSVTFQSIGARSSGESGPAPAPV